MNAAGFSDSTLGFFSCDPHLLIITWALSCVCDASRVSESNSLVTYVIAR